MTVRKLSIAIALAFVMSFGAVSTASACTSISTAWCGKKHSATYNRAAIRKVAKYRGYGTKNTDRLLWLANRESTYRNWVYNGPCKGLFQVNTRKPKSKWANPYWNTNRAINYIKDRYGTPYRAVQHSRLYGWY